jgi:hypothetical protein
VDSEDSSDSSSIGEDETPKSKEFHRTCKFNGNIPEVSQESQTKGSGEETPLKDPGNPKINKFGGKGTTFNAKMDKKLVDKAYHSEETVQIGQTNLESFPKDVKTDNESMSIRQETNTDSSGENSKQNLKGLEGENSTCRECSATDFGDETSKPEIDYKKAPKNNQQNPSGFATNGKPERQSTYICSVGNGSKMLSNSLDKPTKEKDTSGPISHEDCLNSMMGRKQGPVVVKRKIESVETQTIETSPKDKGFGRKETTVDRGAKSRELLPLKGPKDNLNPGGKGNSSSEKGSCGNSGESMDESPSSRQINEIGKHQGSSNDLQFKTMG